MTLRTFISLVLTVFIINCQKESEKLPEFRVRKTDQTVINVSEYTKGKTSLVIHFNADCKTCQDEAQMIVDHLDKLGDVRIIFVSAQDCDKIELFDDYFNLSEHENIMVGQDYKDAMQSHFKIYTTPLIALSDKRGNLRKVMVGEVGPGKLLEFINEIN